MKHTGKTLRVLLGQQRYSALRRSYMRVVNRGDARYCPCCDSHLRAFTRGGVSGRGGVRCPVCGSLERHRLIWMYLHNKTNLFDDVVKRVLHIAPEPVLASLFEESEQLDYLSADLCSPRAMVKMDITQIQYPENTFDVVYCSHVLEHVPEDRLAMREFYRVVKPGGWAILQVPITAEETYEDPAITSPEERLKAFGQHNHVRRYGPDYSGRLAEAGFDVTVDKYAKEMPPEESSRCGLMVDEDVHFCRKPLDG